MKEFLGRRASVWSKLGNAKPGKMVTLAYTKFLGRRASKCSKA